jgi:hypothetical protein
MYTLYCTLYKIAVQWSKNPKDCNKRWKKRHCHKAFNLSDEMMTFPTQSIHKEALDLVRVG